MAITPRKTKTTMQNDNDRLFATQFAEEANAMKQIGAFDADREVWVGSNGSVAGQTVSLFQTYAGGKQVDSGTDADTY